MSELISWMKEVYKKVKANDFEWKNIYPDNMPCNGVKGKYTEMFFKKDGKYTYIKYSIEYCSRCDEDGLSHPEEGTKYYVLHELIKHDLEETFKIPEPSNEFLWDESLACLVNEYGRFRYVFDDEKTAKKVAANDLLMLIYPYTYILNDEEKAEWRAFYESQKKE